MQVIEIKGSEKILTLHIDIFKRQFANLGGDEAMRCKVCGLGLDEKQLICPRCWSSSSDRIQFDAKKANEKCREYKLEHLREYQKERRGE